MQLQSSLAIAQVADVNNGILVARHLDRNLQRSIAVARIAGMQSLHVQTTILPGHRIELIVPELPIGSSVSVVVGPVQPLSRLDEVLGSYSGKQLFQSADEVDSYLHAEREAWDN